MRWISLPEALKLVGELVGPGQTAVPRTDPSHIVYILLPKHGGTKAEAQQAKQALDHPLDQISNGSIWGHTPGQVISGDVVVIGPGVPTMERDAIGTVYRVDSVADLPKVKIAKRLQPPRPPELLHRELFLDALRSGDVKARRRTADGMAKSLRPEQWRHTIDWQTGTLDVGPSEGVRVLDLNTGRLKEPPPRLFALVEIDRQSVVDTFEVADQSPAEQRPATQRRGRKPHGETKDVLILGEFDRLAKAGEVDFTRGGKTKVARAIRVKYPEYKVDTIIRMIKGAFDSYASIGK